MCRKMNVLFMTHHRTSSDGRTNSLVKIIDGQESLFVMSPDSRFWADNLLARVRLASYLIKQNSIDCLFIDNRQATIEGLILKLFFPKMHIIQDSRELYEFGLSMSLKSNIGTMFERIMMKLASVVICANSYRANYMKEKFYVKPFVYENIRKLPEIKGCVEEYSDKYKWLIDEDKDIIIVTSGFSKERLSDKLLVDFKKIQSKFILLYVGDESYKDERLRRSIIADECLYNVYNIKRVPPNELRYLISLAKIGIVSYNQNDFNNKYCASGKIYEFLFQNKPVVTSLNPPLLDICKKYEVGIACSDFAKGILYVNEHYGEFTYNIDRLIDESLIYDNEKNVINALEIIHNEVDR